MAWIDGKGCLTPDGVRAVNAAPVGQAPPELALHVAACGRCQRRVLGLAEAAPGGAARRPAPLRTAIVLLALLLMGLLLLWTARLLLT